VGGYVRAILDTSVVIATDISRREGELAISGHLAAAVVDAGRQPRARSMDLLIAATAQAHSARLYTRNAGDFDGLNDMLEVVAV